MKIIIKILFSLFLISFLSACSQVTHRPSGSRTQVIPQGSQQHSTQRQLSQRPTVNRHPSRNLMVRIARDTIGTPYKWGGNSPQKGFDCSGLMTYIHTNALGMKIPRTAAQQRDNSKTISYAQLQPGDMLFFKTSRTSNHVGIYIGNRQFIHAPSGGKRVKITTMDSSYWFKRFVKFGTYL